MEYKYLGRITEDEDDQEFLDNYLQSIEGENNNEQ